MSHTGLSRAAKQARAKGLPLTSKQRRERRGEPTGDAAWLLPATFRPAHRAKKVAASKKR